MTRKQKEQELYLAWFKIIIWQTEEPILSQKGLKETIQLSCKQLVRLKFEIK